MVLLWLSRTLRESTGFIPFGTTLSGFATLALTFIPATRHALFSWVLPSMVPSTGTDWMAWLTARDPVMNLPVGLIVVTLALMATMGTATFGANMSMKYFAAEPVPPGEVASLLEATGVALIVCPLHHLLNVR